MKTKMLSKNLSFKKLTVVNLNNDEMTEIQGGAITSRCSQVISCDTSTCNNTGIMYTCTTSVPGYC
jgi:hypothetical protein